MSHLSRHPQFPLNGNILYFNHAAISPWPKCTVEAIEDFSLQNLHTGSSNYMKWLDTEASLRESLRALINAGSVDDIALLKNTSEGLSVIAYGLDWFSGDNIVIPIGEFPSNRIVWQSLQQFGVETREIDIRATDDPEQAIIDATDEKTRLVAVSSVQYTDGFRLDLVKLGAFLSDKPIFFVVDAIQQLGALPFDLSQIQADFVVADGHKWMLGPEGLALFYSSPDARSQLKLNQYGWRMIENPDDFSQQIWQISENSKRFECGSPNMLAIFALDASLKLIAREGIGNIAESILSNTHKILEYINNNNSYTLLSPTTESRRAGIVLFKHKQIDNKLVFEKLTAAGVQCAARGDGVRLSPHFYHKNWEFDALFKQLSSI